MQKSPKVFTLLPLFVTLFSFLIILRKYKQNVCVLFVENLKRFWIHAGMHNV